MFNNGVETIISSRLQELLILLRSEVMCINSVSHTHLLPANIKM